MKFSCQRTALLDALKIVSAAIAGRTTRPILSNVKAVAANGTLTLTATDLELGIRYELRGVDVHISGEAILAATKLGAILRETDDAEVTVQATDDGAKVLVGSSKFELPGYPVNEFPDLPAAVHGRHEHYHEITAGDLRALIRAVAFAADRKDSTRFALAGILWEVEGKLARLVATDSKRLAICERPATVHGDLPKGSHLLPIKAMKLLEANLTDDGEIVMVYLGPNEAIFQTERAMIHTRLLEGRYPAYREIIKQTKKQADKTILLPREAFLSRVRQAAVMTDEESRRIDITIDTE